MSTLIPNTFQCFNLYIDRALEHLTDSEVRVLWFATRHILGWQDTIKERHKHISLSMFENGYTTKTGRYGGCGLGRGAIIAACNNLVDFKFLARIGKADEYGQTWELTVDDIQWDALEARTVDKDAQSRNKTQKATIARMNKRAGTSNEPLQGGTSDVTMQGTSDVTTPHNVARTQSKPSSKPSSKPHNADAIPTNKYPKAIKSYTTEHICAYQKQHSSDLVVLVKAWAGDMYSAITEFSTKVGRMYIEVHQELMRLNKSNTEYAALAVFTKKKDAWKSNPLVTDMLLYVTEYAPVKVAPTPNKPLTEWEYEWAKIQEQQQQEAALYGRS